MDLRSDWWSLDWSGAERYRCCYQRMEKVSPNQAHMSFTWRRCALLRAPSSL